MDKQTAGFGHLRRQARARIKREPPADLTFLSSKNTPELIEELYIHQVELEMQNEELRQGYEELEILHNRYQALYDFAPVGYFTLDQNGYILDVNITGASQLEMVRQSLLNRRLTDYIARDSQDAFYLHRQKLLLKKTKQICELELVTASGLHFHGQLESVIVEKASSEVPQIQMALIDITARKDAEAALKQQRDHLEELVTARTAELAQANEQLQAEIDERRQAQTSLQASHERLEETLAQLEATQHQVVQQERLAAVGQLAAGIAHDFNNILTSIIGYADLLLRQSNIVGSQSEGRVAIIREQATRAGHLVRQILDFSRKTVRQPRPIELGVFLNDTVRLLRRMIPETIRIQLDAEPGEYWLNTDPTQIQQVITNLGLNACDAMPSGGVFRLHLSHFSLKPDDSPPLPKVWAGRWILLTVTDTGSGIPAEALPHIFEPFFTTKPPGQGSGLGLAQVYGIVQQYGGDIAVRSRPNEGASFTLYLPWSPPATKPLAEETSADLPLAHGECILLVEDEVSVLQVVRAMLETLNYRVLTAANGQEALTIYQAKKDEITLVLTDKVMPELDGMALLQALRTENPQVKVIIMSGYPLGTATDQFVAQGTINWLKKPPTLDQLARIVSQTLQSG